MQDLYQWKLEKIEPSYAELVHASQIRVCVPCTKFTPKLDEVSISRTEDSRIKRNVHPELTELTLRHAHRLLLEKQCENLPAVSGIASQDDHDAHVVLQVLDTLGDFWQAVAELRKQLTFIAIKYPLDVTVASMDEEGSDEVLHMKTTILYKKAKAKVFMTFIMDMPTFTRWPLSIGSLQVDVQVAYGKVE